MSETASGAASLPTNSLGTGDVGQPILDRDAFTIEGNAYTMEVTPHWFAGHGVVEGWYRWTVYFENEYRPIVMCGVWSSVEGAREKFEAWLAGYRVAVAGETMRRNQF